MRHLVIFILLAVLSLSGGILVVLAQSSETYVQELNTPVEAPNFLLKEISGKEVSLKEFRGKIVLLNFFTTW
jgi:cytochrome oxidase Cu insertion factor (SCO1/SenC/PrrC family)